MMNDLRKIWLVKRGENADFEFKAIQKERKQSLRGVLCRSNLQKTS